MFKNIMVAHDGTDCSDRALDYAIGLAKTSGAQLTVCHVTDIASAIPVVAMPAATFPGPLCQVLYDEAASIAQHVRGRAAEAGVLVTIRDVEGRPPHAILEIAKDARADLVVVGTHGRHGFESFLAPSVAQRVARDIHVPLLIVPTDSPAFE